MKNTLVQYQGGGYDGCIWEWNFAYYDDKGKFHDIFSSGSMCCKTEQDLKAHRNDKRNEADVYEYRTNIKKDMRDFTTEVNEGLVIAVAKVLQKKFGVEISAKCDCCGVNHPADLMIPMKPMGAGGTRIKYTSMICEDCYSSYSCSYCGEYYGQEHNFDDEGYCEYCHKDKNPDEVELTDDELLYNAVVKADKAKNLEFSY